MENINNKKQKSYYQMVNEGKDSAFIQQNSKNKQRKQLVNFKQMIKVQILKKQQKVHHQHQFKSQVELKNQQQKKKSINSLIKKPLQTKLFNQAQVSDRNIYIPSKNSNILIFPCVKLGEQRRSLDSKSINRLQFFHKIREISMRKVKEEATKMYKRKQRKMKSRYSSINFPEKVECRTITPLDNQGLSQSQLFSLREQLRTSNKIYEQKRSNSRYQDIPISEFIYESNELSSKEGIQIKYQSKIAKICRKKSLTKKEPAIRN